MARPAAGLRRLLEFLVHRDLRAAVHLARGLPDTATHRTRQEPARGTGAGPAQPGPAAQTSHRVRRGRAAAGGGRDERAAHGLAQGHPHPGRRDHRSRPGATSVTEISAEKGYLREFGNIVFHFSLLGLLVAIAAGKLFGYEGNVIVVADGGPGFCSASPAAFDSFRAGNTVDGTSLYPICLKVNDFQADYLDNGQATSYSADIEYQAGDDLTTGTWRPYELKVNEPLRVAGDRVYLQGHGYAPTFTVTFPDGQTRTQTLQWRPDDQTTFLSSGVMRFDPPAGTYPDADERRKNQLAIQGLFAPTQLLHGTLLSSSFPEMRDPGVAIDIYRGDTGLDSGRPQNIFTLDERLIGRAGSPARRASTSVSVRRPGSTTAPWSGSTAPCRSSASRCRTTRRRSGCSCSR